MRRTRKMSMQRCNRNIRKEEEEENPKTMPLVQLVQLLEPKLLAYYLEEIAKFLKNDKKDLWFPLISETLEAFLVRMIQSTQNLRNLLHVLDPKSRSLAIDIIDTIEANKNVYTVLHSFANSHVSKNILVYRKMFDRKLPDVATVINQLEKLCSKQCRDDCEESCSPTKPKCPIRPIDETTDQVARKPPDEKPKMTRDCKIHWINKTMTFIEDDTVDCMEYPDMDIEQSEYIYSLSQLARIGSDQDPSMRDAYVPLKGALKDLNKTHELKSTFTYLCGNRGVRLALEKVPINNNKSLPRKPAKNERNTKSLETDNASKTQKSFARKTETIKVLEPKFIRTSLHMLLDFIDEATEASIVFRNADEKQCMFLQTVITTAKTKKLHELFSEECKTILRKIAARLQNDKFELKIDLAKMDRNSTLRTVSFIKVPKEKSRAHTPIPCCTPARQRSPSVDSPNRESPNWQKENQPTFSVNSSKFQPKNTGQMSPRRGADTSNIKKDLSEKQKMPIKKVQFQQSSSLLKNEEPIHSAQKQSDHAKNNTVKIVNPKTEIKKDEFQESSTLTKHEESIDTDTKVTQQARSVNKTSPLEINGSEQITIEQDKSTIDSKKEEGTLSTSQKTAIDNPKPQKEDFIDNPTPLDTVDTAKQKNSKDNPTKPLDTVDTGLHKTVINCTVDKSLQKTVKENIKSVDSGNTPVHKTTRDNPKLVDTTDKALQMTVKDNTKTVDSVDTAVHKTAKDNPKLVDTVDKSLQKTVKDNTKSVDTIDTAVHNTARDNSKLVDTVAKASQKSVKDNIKPDNGKSEPVNTFHKLQNTTKDHSKSEVTINKAKNTTRLDNPNLLDTIDKAVNKSAIEKPKPVDTVTLQITIDKDVRTINSNIIDKAQVKGLGLRKTRLIEGLSTPLESDVAMRMMRQMGWEGGPLGARGDGLVEPVIPPIHLKQGAGLGHVAPKKEPKTSKPAKSTPPKLTKSPETPELPADPIPSKLSRTIHIHKPPNVRLDILRHILYVIVEEHMELVVVYSTKLAKKELKFLENTIKVIARKGSLFFNDNDMQYFYGRIIDELTAEPKLQVSGVASSDKKLIFSKTYLTSDPKTEQPPEKPLKPTNLQEKIFNEPQLESVMEIANRYIFAIFITPEIITDLGRQVAPTATTKAVKVLGHNILILAILLDFLQSPAVERTVKFDYPITLRKVTYIREVLTGIRDRMRWSYSTSYEHYLSMKILGSTIDNMYVSAFYKCNNQHITFKKNILQRPSKIESPEIKETPKRIENTKDNIAKVNSTNNTKNDVKTNDNEVIEISDSDDESVKNYVLNKSDKKKLKNVGNTPIASKVTAVADKDHAKDKESVEDSTNNAKVDENSRGAISKRPRSNSNESVNDKTKSNIKYVCIAPEGYPIENVGVDDIITFQNKVFEKLETSKDKPLLECLGIKNGAIIYACYNEYGSKVIENAAKEMRMNTINITNLYKKSQPYKVIARINSYVEINLKNLFKKVETYNVGLKTDLWVVTDVQAGNGHVAVSLEIDEDSFNYIARDNFSIFVGIDKMRFSVSWD